MSHILFILFSLLLGTNVAATAAKSAPPKPNSSTDDFSLCVVAQHGRCFEVKGGTLHSSEAPQRPIDAELHSKLGSEVQRFFNKTAYAIPFRNSSANSCQFGLTFRSGATAIDRCAEKLTAKDNAELQRLFGKFSDQKFSDQQSSETSGGKKRSTQDTRSEKLQRAEQNKRP